MHVQQFFQFVEREQALIPSLSKLFVDFFDIFFNLRMVQGSMKKWFQVMCVVRLGAPVSRKNELGDIVNVIGYVINVGLPALNVIQAISEVERIALAKFDGPRNGNFIEEANIKTTDLESLRAQFHLEEKTLDGESIFRSALMCFDE